MDTPLEETKEDGLIRASADDDDPVDVTDDASKPAPAPAPAAEAPKKPKGSGPAGEDSYEDGWYQVLKRRADEDAEEG